MPEEREPHLYYRLRWTNSSIIASHGILVKHCTPANVVLLVTTEPMFRSDDISYINFKRLIISLLFPGELATWVRIDLPVTSDPLDRFGDGFVDETDPLHCYYYHATGGRGLVLCLSVSY